MSDPRLSVARDLALAHRRLAADLQQLVELAGPQPDRERLHQRLGLMQTHLAEHIRFEELGGYMTAVVQRVPHLSRKVEALRQEHTDLIGRLDQLHADARDAAVPGEALADRVRQWVETVHRHEAQENVLVEDAFNLDVSAED